jgi:polysaccharide chain length determinant protein (PEP-CTERM system associated)
MTLSTSVPGVQPYLDMLRRRRRLALWSGLTILVISGAFVLGLPELYRANATLIVQGAVPEAFVQASVPGEINARLQVLKQEALSRRRLTALVERFRLYGHQPGRPVTDTALARLERDIRVDVTSDTTRQGQPTAVSFTVSYAATDPRTAADVTNELAAFYVAHNEETRTRQASVATSTIAAQLEATRADLETQSARISTYTSRNIGALPQQIDANLSAINRLDAQFQRNADELLRQMERRQVLQSEMATIDTRLPAADENTAAARLARAESELADLRSRFSDSYPDVLTKRTEVDKLRREVTTAGRGAAGTRVPTPRTAADAALKETDANIARIERDQANLRQQIETYQRRVERAPANEPAFDSLVREYQATRERLDLLQRRLDEAHLAERAERGGEAQELRVLDAAVPPVGPSGPARGMLLGLSLLLAVAVGVGLAMLVDLTDTSFHTMDELRAFTKVPVLASIPEIATARTSARVRDLALACAQLVALGALAFGAFHLAHYGDRVVRVLSRVS